MTSNNHDLRNNAAIIWGRTSKELGAAMANHLDIPVVEKTDIRFGDDEISFEHGNVRGKTIILVASGAGNPTEAVVETSLMVETLKRTAARTIVDSPYMQYSRAERTDNKRVPLAARFTANLYELHNPDRIFLTDLHVPTIQGFFQKSTPSLIYNTCLFAENIAHMVQHMGVDPDNILIMGPDRGSIPRVTHLIRQLRQNHGLRISPEYAYIDKIHNEDNKTEIVNFVNSHLVKGKLCIIVDDIVASGGTLENCATEAKKYGAVAVIAYSSHGVCERGPDNIPKIIPILQKPGAKLDGLVILNSIQQPDSVLQSPHIQVLDASEWFAANIEHALFLPDGSVTEINQGVRKVNLKPVLPPGTILKPLASALRL